jgi:hypothetical protein
MKIRFNISKHDLISFLNRENVILSGIGEFSDHITIECDSNEIEVSKRNEVMTQVRLNKPEKSKKVVDSDEVIFN